LASGFGKKFQVIFSQVRVEKAFEDAEKVKFMIGHLFEHRGENPVVTMRNYCMKAEDKPRYINQYKSDCFDITKIIRNPESTSP